MPSCAKSAGIRAFSFSDLGLLGLGMPGSGLQGLGLDAEGLCLE